MNGCEPIILLVEDNPDDVFFMRHALKKAGVSASLQVATDGQQAVDYFTGAGRYADRSQFPLPSVVFMDLKLPCLNGFEVLAWMRGQAAFDEIPVFILSGSSEERDRKKAGELDAKGYLVKPPEPPALRQIVDWLHGQK